MKKIFTFLILICVTFRMYAQCPQQGAMLSYSVTNFTNVQCTANGYILDGYVVGSGNFTPPYSNPSIVPLTGGGSPTATASDDTLFFQGVNYVSGNSPNSNFNIIFTDSCNNIDTFNILLYGLNVSPVNSTGVFTYCDSSFKTNIQYEVNGLGNFQVQHYNPNTGIYEPFSASVSVSVDSIIITGIYPEQYGQSLYNYLLKYTDSCGNAYNTYIYSSLENYNTQASGGTYRCDSTGIYGAVVYPSLNPPYTYIGFDTSDVYNSSNFFTPYVVINNDSIVINKTVPFVNYSFRFLDGCGDTFKVYYSSYNASDVDFYPVFNGKTCDTGHSVHVITAGAGPYYDPVIEYGPSVNLTSIYFPDSLVISGFANTADFYIVSYRDSTCHNRRYFYYYSPYNYFLSNENPNWGYNNDSCNGDGFSLKAVLPGVAPFSNFILLEGPNNPGVTYTADTITLSHLTNLLNNVDDTLYSFSLQDACGNTDTFRIPSGSIYSQMVLNKIYEVGGCSGIDNAAVTLSAQFYSNPQPYPTPFINAAVSGPGSPSVATSGNTISLTNLVSNSTYLLSFEDSCGHRFSYEYISAESNTPMAVDIKASIDGVCIPTDSINGHYAIKVRINGVNYPYNAYLSGPVNDTILNLSDTVFSFANLETGTYSVIVEDVCNNVNTQNYTISNPYVFPKISYGNFKSFLGCDSIRYTLTEYFQNIYNLPFGIDFNLHFKGPYSAFVVRNTTDTFWSYVPDTSYDVGGSKSMDFTFPSRNDLTTPENVYLIDGCNDTLITNIYYYNYPSYNLTCDSGTLHNTWIIRYDNYTNYNFNFPITLTYSSGTYDTSTIYINSSQNMDTVRLAVGEFVSYTVKDSCGIVLTPISLYGPQSLSSYYTTRICNPATSGKHKGNVSIYTYYNTPNDSMKYTFISGPQVVFTDTTVRYAGLTLNNIDTGTYVFAAKEVNDCGREDTFTIRVEPFLDSLSYTFVPGCLNANKLVAYYFSNQNSGTDYNNLISSGVTLNIRNQNYTFYQNFNPGDTVYNLQSNKLYYISSNCSVDTVLSPAYISPKISSYATFSCSTGYSLAILGSGGAQPYSYEILSGTPVNYSAPSQPSNIFNSLPGTAGNSYQVRITDKCGNAFTTIVKADSISNPMILSGFPCIGSNYTVTVDSIPGINYSWSGPNAFSQDYRTLTFNPVTETDTGNYILTLTNNLTNCSLSVAHTVTVKQCVLGMGEVHTDITCNGDSTGSIDITPFGGIAPYTYSWSNGATTQDINNIPAGTYQIILTDAANDKDTLEIIITQPDLITLNAATTNVTCNGQANGNIDLTVSGGVPPYTFEWSNNIFTEDNSGLAAGSYTVVVADSNNCSKTLTVIITQPDTLKLQEVHQDIACFGEDNGSINLTITGGTAPYIINWNNGAAIEDLNGLAPGTYSVIVTDSNNCSQSLADIIIAQPASALSATNTKTDVNCNGQSTGSIDVTVSGGTAPYTYQWSGGSVATTEDLNNISAGTYDLQITDANGCIAAQSITITEQALLSVTATITDANCITMNDGAIDLGLSGGVSPYSFDWSDGSTTEDIANLQPGTFNVSITDASSCTFDTSFDVGTADCEPIAITDYDTTTLNVPVNGSVTDNDTCGNNPCTYSANPADEADNGTVIFNPDGTFTYTPDAGYYGTDTFSYSICDVDGDCDTAQVIITIINLLPVAVDDNYSGNNGDDAIHGDVSSNDTVGDGTNTFAASYPPLHGSVTMNHDGTFTYIPAPDYSGSDSFTYTICDENNDCDTATVYLSSILPIELISFEARATGNCAVELKWMTGLEDRFRGFEVEQSSDATNYKEIGRQEAKGSGSKYIYQYNNAEHGRNYFRLKLVDLDYSYEYSWIATVYVDCDADRSIKVYPTVTESSVIIDGVRKGERILLFDASGRQMLIGKAENTREQLDLSSYAQGSYNIVIITDSGESLNFKVVRK